MYREMRRKDKELKNEEVVEILKNSTYGILSTVSPDGYPYGVPLNYVYCNNAIYFHSSVEGHKIDNLINDNRVSFCIVGETCILPGEFNIKFESAIVFGTAVEIINDEKYAAFLDILYKYSPDYIEKGKEYIAKAGNATKVFKINIDHMSGKAKR